jgi:hypothetical protein
MNEPDYKGVFFRLKGQCCFGGKKKGLLLLASSVKDCFASKAPKKRSLFKKIHFERTFSFGSLWV